MSNFINNLDDKIETEIFRLNARFCDDDQFFIIENNKKKDIFNSVHSIKFFPDKNYIEINYLKHKRKNSNEKNSNSNEKNSNENFQNKIDFYYNIINEIIKNENIENKIKFDLILIFFNKIQLNLNFFVLTKFNQLLKKIDENFIENKNIFF